MMPRKNNFVFNLGEKISNVFGLSWFGFHLMTPPDELHTLLKGLVENVLAWTFNLLHYMRRINSHEYKDVIANIDRMFADFPLKQSITDVRLVQKVRGVSMLFTEANSRKASANQGTSIMTGGTPA